MTDVGVCLVQSPLLKAGSARTGYLGTWPVGFWIYPRMGHPQSRWATYPSAESPLRYETFLMFKWNSLYLILCLSPLVLSLCTTDSSLSLSCVHHLIRYLNTLERSPACKPYWCQVKYLLLFSSMALLSPTKPVIWWQKVLRHNFFFINANWLIPATFLTFRCAGMFSRIICSIIFPRIEVRFQSIQNKIKIILKQI